MIWCFFLPSRLAKRGRNKNPFPRRVFFAPEFCQTKKPSHEAIWKERWRPFRLRDASYRLASGTAHGPEKWTSGFRKRSCANKRKWNAGRRIVLLPARKRRAGRATEIAACAALRLRARSPAGIPLAVFANRTFVPRAQLRARLPEDSAKARTWPPTPSSVTAMHLARRSYCRQA